MNMTRTLLALALFGALLAAPAASAMYIITPLKIQVSDDTPQVGDTITLTIVPDPEYDDPNATSLAGKSIVVKLNYDPKEGDENSEPGSAQPVFLEIGTVTLDDKQSATLTYTIPQELDDHNAFLTAVDEKGNDVGAGYGPIAVGDAPPIMMIMRNTPAEGGAQPQPEGTGTVGEEAQGNLDDTPPAETSGEDVAAEDAKDNATPALGLAAFIAVAAIAALVVRKRR